ncbi:MAG: tripartite tricarboxylate transporter substrate binding protein [Betaproteobacteria bacterium]|nr:tripartite tricarboxylate transporter substrate binding protein [Betaproteobacteria bacterium]
MTRHAFILVVVVSAALTVTTAAAAEYPARPVRYIVPSPAGGGPDTTARILAAELSRQIGQQFVVDNRPGASGTIGMALLARAAPDGYTISQAPTPTLAIVPSVLPKLGYDPLRDVQAVVQLNTSYNMLVATPSLPVKSVQELIDYARKNPNKLLFASSGIASTLHLSGELFKLMTGTQMLHVPFKGAALAMADVTAGRVHLMFDNIQSIGPHVKAARVKGLGVISAKRSPVFPELPTIAEAGVPGFEVTAWGGIVVPAGVSKAIVARLNAEFNKALASPTVREKFAALDIQPVGGTPERFAALIRSETVKWADVVKRAGVKVD